MTIKHLVESLLHGAHNFFPLIDSNERVIEPRHAIQKLNGHLVDDIQVVVEFVFLDLFGKILLLLSIGYELDLLPFFSDLVILPVHLLTT